VTITRVSQTVSAVSLVLFPLSILTYWLLYPAYGLARFRPPRYVRSTDTPHEPRRRTSSFSPEHFSRHRRRSLSCASSTGVLRSSP
jgi:hypothetical protein